MNPSNTRTFDPKEAIVQHMHMVASITHRCEPDNATIQFLKARVVPTHQVHYVLFQDTTGQPWYFNYLLSHRKDGSWYVKNAGGSREQDQFEPLEMRDCPWFRINGLSILEHISDEFYMYGEVLDKGFDIARVRLLGANGPVLEDTVQDGLVFFWSDQKVVLPIQLELYNCSNEVVSRQSLAPPFLPSATRVIERL